MLDDVVKQLLENQVELRTDIRKIADKQDKILDAVHTVGLQTTTNTTLIAAHDKLDDQRFTNQDKKLEVIHTRIDTLKEEMKSSSTPDKRLITIIAVLAGSVASGFTKLLSVVVK